MTRRSFVEAICFSSLLVYPITRGYGRVDVDRWCALGLRQYGYHVCLDGVDITDDCFEFHDREGWAKVFRRDANGRHYLDVSGRGAATRTLRGVVTIHR